MHLLFLLSKLKWLPRLALLLVSLGSLGCLKSKSHQTKPEEQIGDTGRPQAKAWESKFDLNLHSLAEAHPQTKQILESNINNLPEKPLMITSSLVSPKGQVFYFTKIIQGESDQRHLVIMFTKNKTGLFVPRLLYKSQSDGSWMVSPTTYVMFGNLSLSKGKEIHFTQETKVIEEIINHLDKASAIYNLFYSLAKNNFKDTSATIGYNFFNMLKEDKDREKIFNYDLNKEVDNIAKGVYTYEEEVKKFPLTPSDLLKKFQDCQPYSCFGSEKTSGLSGEALKKAQEHNNLDAPYFENLFKSLTYPAQFLPDFSQLPIRTYKYDHSLAGTVTVEVLPAKLSGQNIEWHFTRDNKGRIWIDRISLAERNINSYGILNQVIDSGLLTNRQVEYQRQSNLLWEDDNKLINGQKIDFYLNKNGEETPYMDLSPLLDLLKPIEEFRKARKITRTK